MGKPANKPNSAITCKQASEDSRVMTLDAIADSMNVSRERIRQIEKSAMAKVRAGFERRGYTEADIHDYLTSLGERSWVRFTD